MVLPQRLDNVLNFRVADRRFTHPNLEGHRDGLNERSRAAQTIAQPRHTGPPGWKRVQTNFWARHGRSRTRAQVTVMTRPVRSAVAVAEPSRAGKISSTRYRPA